MPTNIPRKDLLMSQHPTISKKRIYCCKWQNGIQVVFSLAQVEEIVLRSQPIILRFESFLFLFSVFVVILCQTQQRLCIG